MSRHNRHMLCQWATLQEDVRTTERPSAQTVVYSFIALAPSRGKLSFICCGYD